MFSRVRLSPETEAAGRVEAGKECAGSSNVLFNLGTQGFGTGESLLVAQAEPEADFHLSGSDFLGKVEEVRLDGKLGAIEGRTNADVCGRAIAAAQNDRFGSVDAARGEKFLFGGEIQRGEDEAAASASADSNFAGEREWTTEQTCSLRQVAIGNGGANSAARNDHATQDHRGYALDVEIQAVAQSAAEFAEDRNIASLAMAEAKILTDAYDTGVHGLDENAPDEITWGERGDGVVERQNENCIEAKRFETGKTLRERVNQRRRNFRSNDAQRMRPESECGGDVTFAAGAFDDAFDDLLVAEVDAVEIPNREDRAGIRAKFGGPLIGRLDDGERHQKAASNARPSKARRTFAGSFRLVASWARSWQMCVNQAWRGASSRTRASDWSTVECIG